MIISLWLLASVVVSGGPWVLTSHRVIEPCRGRTCLVAPGSPQRWVVQRFPTPQECQAVQQQRNQERDRAEGAVNAEVQARSPRAYLRTTTTFRCGGMP
jgi:hypothetical protein